MHEKTRVIVMLGPQGSGKGTQAEILAARFGIPAVSLGQLLRKEIDAGTELGRSIAETVNAGSRVSEEVVDRLMGERLARPDAAQGAILDGYPRGIDQMDEFARMLSRRQLALTDVVFLDIADDESRRRLSGRWICGNNDCEAKYHIELHPPKAAGVCDRCGSRLVQRADDTPEGIERRLAIYHRDTEPLVAAFRELGVLRHINGAQSIQEVAEEVARKLE